MMLLGHAWSLLFFLAAIIPDVHVQRNGESVQPSSDSGSQTYQPVLQPKEAVPPIGTYMLKDPAGKLCIKATVGVEFIVTEKTMSRYFTLDPSGVSIHGYCSEEAAGLSLTLPNNNTSLELTFTKEKDLSYLAKLSAHVSPLPLCPGCPNKTYSGSTAREKLFSAPVGQSFKCESESVLVLSPELRLKLVPVQLQAFNVSAGGQYGLEVECWADYTRRVIPIILFASVLGVLLIVVQTLLFIRERRTAGYHRL